MILPRNPGPGHVHYATVAKDRVDLRLLRYAQSDARMSSVPVTEAGDLREECSLTFALRTETGVTN